MSFNNAIPGWMVQGMLEDEKYTAQGMQDWAPEDAAEEVVTLDEEQELWRIVDENGRPYKSAISSAYNKPYYASERGAKSALGQLCRHDANYRVQKGTVTWGEFIE